MLAGDLDSFERGMLTQANRIAKRLYGSAGTAVTARKGDERSALLSDAKQSGRTEGGGGGAGSAAKLAAREREGRRDAGKAGKLGSSPLIQAPECDERLILAPGANHLSWCIGERKYTCGRAMHLRM